jgi:arsenate reductase
MNQLTVYHYAACSTCKNAIKWLKANGHDLNLIPIVDQPPTVEVLQDVLHKSGLDIKKLFNTSGVVYKEQNIKDKIPTMSEADMLKLLASNGKLIKRPLVISTATATVGFQEANFATVWGN